MAGPRLDHLTHCLTRPHVVSAVLVEVGRREDASLRTVYGNDPGVNAVGRSAAEPGTAAVTGLADVPIHDDHVSKTTGIDVLVPDGAAGLT